MNKKKISIWKIIWISCLFLSLIGILLLVVDYKVRWENKETAHIERIIIERKIYGRDFSRSL